MIDPSQFRELNRFDWIMLAAFSLAATETVVYFTAISNVPAEGRVNYGRLMTDVVRRLPADAVVIFFANLLFATYLVTTVRAIPMELKWSWTDPFVGVILSNFLSRFVLEERLAPGKLLAASAVGLLLGFVTPLTALLGKAVSFAAAVAVALWLVAFLLITRRYGREREFFSPAEVGNYGYWKDGVLMLVCVVLIAVVPPVVRRGALNSQTLVTLMVGVVVVGAVAALADLRFGGSEHGKVFASRLLELSSWKPPRDDHTRGQLIQVIDTHAIVRTTGMLLVGVVGTFALEILRQVQRLQAP